MTFQERLKRVFDKYGTTELKVHMLLNLYDDVVALHAKDQKEGKQKLQDRIKELRQENEQIRKQRKEATEENAKIMALTSIYYNSGMIDAFEELLEK